MEIFMLLRRDEGTEQRAQRGDQGTEKSHTATMQSCLV